MPMVSAVIHRRWAREYLCRAERAMSRDDKRRFLRLAVNNCVRAQALESESAAAPDWRFLHKVVRHSKAGR
jgi:hypothetical protein